MVKNIKFAVVVLLAIITFASCKAFKEASEMAKVVNLSSIKLGMSKAEVQTQLNKKPDNIIATKIDPGTNAMLEVVQYTQWEQTTKIESYWLYFVNDKLDKWEKASKEHKPWL